MMLNMYNSHLLDDMSSFDKAYVTFSLLSKS